MRRAQIICVHVVPHLAGVLMNDVAGPEREPVPAGTVGQEALVAHLGQNRRMVDADEHSFGAGRAFLEREGRLIERRLAATLFDGAPAGAVIDTLRGYRNPDGGFGHGLEPDKRCPDSLPIDVEGAFEIMLVAGAVDEAMVLYACDWLARWPPPTGRCPCRSPSSRPIPGPSTGRTGPTRPASTRRPGWPAACTAWGWATPGSTGPRSGAGAGWTRRASTRTPTPSARSSSSWPTCPTGPGPRRSAPSVGGWLAKAQWYRADPDDPSYGVTPLDFAPEPDGPWSHLFDTATIEGHLDRLRRDQQPDGGWAITWEPPGTASTLEWRGILTLWALRVLRAYGRLGVDE